MSEQIGRVNGAIKSLLLQVKTLAAALPDVESRDTAQIVTGCQEISRLTTAFTATLRDAMAANSNSNNNASIAAANQSASSAMQFDESMLGELKDRVQAFLALVKNFVAMDTYDDDATNATVLAITAAIKPVIEVVNKRKTLLLQQQQDKDKSTPSEDSVPAAYSTSPPIPIASSAAATSNAAAASSPPTSSPPAENSTSVSSSTDASGDGAKKESFARKFSRSISNARDQVLSRLKRSQTNDGDDPNAPSGAGSPGTGDGDAQQRPSSPPSSPRGSAAANVAGESADGRDSTGKSAEKPNRFRDLFRSNSTASSAEPAATAEVSASARASNNDEPHEPPKRKNSAPGSSNKPGFMENMKRRFRLPQGWYKFKLSKEKKEQTKKKLENDLQQIDDVESEPIVEQMKKLDDETVTAGDVGEIAIAVKTARTNLEARQSTSTPAQNTKARESIIVLKSMEATLAQTLRDSIVIAPAAAATAASGGAPPSPPSARTQQSQPPIPSSKPAAKSTTATLTRAAAPAAAATVDDTAELDALLGNVDTSVDLVALDSILLDKPDEPTAAAAATSSGNHAAAASEEEQWGAIEDLLSEYA